MATSEQLNNLYSTTLASGYTAGAGSISVASAGSYVNGGPFSLTILDQTTGAVKLIFRVTSVSGTTFTGAAEGTDANAASGDIVVGSMLTVAALNQILAIDNGPLFQLTDPKLQSWSMVHTGSVTVDTSHRGIGLVNPASESGINAHLYVFAVPATPYHVEFCITSRRNNSTNNLTGVCFTNGNSGTPKAMIWGEYQTVVQQHVQFFLSDPTTYGGSTPINDSSIYFDEPYQFYRLGDDGSGGGSARTYDKSHDGIDWYQMGAESRTSQFAASHIGIFLNAGVNSLRCYSVKVTG